MKNNFSENKIDGEIESEFYPHEIFISKTDKKGIIKLGNPTFFRISEYSRDELLDRPHNTIRHPNMPRAIFKLLWSEIKKDQMLAAYVKNRTKKGKFYWVFALVFPTDDGYFSIRIKPKSEFFNKLEPLYRELLSIEDMNGQADDLNKVIHEMGFKSYHELMLAMLIDELKLRDMKRLDPSQTITLNFFIDSISEVKRLAWEGCFALAEPIERATYYFRKELLTESQIHKFSQVFENLDYLAFNMSIVAHGLGKMGGTLAVISNNFQSTARQVMKQYELFKDKLERVQSNLAPNILKVCCLRLQSEMLGYFAEEILNEKSEMHMLNSKSYQLDKSREIRELIDCIIQLSNDSIESIKSFYHDLHLLKKDTKSLLNLIIRLDLIRTGGKLEGSRSQEVISSFLPFINEMNQFVEAVLNPIENILIEVDGMCGSFEKISMSSRHISFNWEQLSEISNQLQLHLDNKQTLLKSA